jgi:hypothetical protein
MTKRKAKKIKQMVDKTLYRKNWRLSNTNPTYVKVLNSGTQ